MAPPVVLLHGFATTAARTWGETGWIDLLADAGREVVAVDLLGHGEAPRPHDPQAYAGLEDHVAATIGDGPYDAVGFSLGARTLLTLATRSPGLFERIVVGGVGAGLLTDDTAMRERVAAALMGQAGDDVVARHFEALASEPGSDRDALLACISHARPPLDPADLALVDARCLVVIGDRDDQGPPEPLAEALPDARCVVLGGVDHFALPRSFGFIDAALEFLDAAP
ncbi:MAG: alpha/beta fold hydrolase [Acidimicrobiales bacterium]